MGKSWFVDSPSRKYCGASAVEMNDSCSAIAIEGLSIFYFKLTGKTGLCIWITSHDNRKLNT